ncbi:MAG: ATP-binding protein [Ilumatobacteraceae bacterium]
MQPSLRAKGTVAGVLAAFTVSVAASCLTYFVGRSYLISQRESTAVTQAVAAARTAGTALSGGLTGIEAVVKATRTLPGSLALLTVDGESFASGVGISQEDIPPGFVDSLASGQVVQQRIVLRDEPRIVVGAQYESDVDAWFVALLPMTELRDTLGVLRNALSLGVVVASIAGGGLGRRLSRRVMEPLRAIGVAASDISAGDLTRRVTEPREPDLAVIARAFNEMTAGLSDRIIREIQFGAMVSHELRTPLTVIRGAAEMISTSTIEFDEKSKIGLHLLHERIDDFERILNDLIEISRYGSHTVTPNIETRAVSQLIEAIFARLNIDKEICIFADPGMVDSPEMFEVLVDVKRLIQTFENLRRNADLYAGGLTAVRVETTADKVLIHFDDAGSGVVVSEREAIFESFVRAQRHSAIPGTGLGLAISREHCRVSGGDLLVGDSPDGGARFTVIVPRVAQ